MISAFQTVFVRIMELAAYSGENGPLVRAKWASRWKWLGGGVGNGFILT
jgi:hypothetical protein